MFVVFFFKPNDDKRERETLQVKSLGYACGCVACSFLLERLCEAADKWTVAAAAKNNKTRKLLFCLKLKLAKCRELREIANYNTLTNITPTELLRANQISKKTRLSSVGGLCDDALNCKMSKAQDLFRNIY